MQEDSILVITIYIKLFKISGIIFSIKKQNNLLSNKNIATSSSVVSRTSPIVSPTLSYYCEPDTVLYRGKLTNVWLSKI